MRADETARRSGRHRQSHRTRRRGHWRGDRPAGPAGNRSRQTTRLARGFQTEYPENVCTDGRRPGSRRGRRNRGTDGQDRGTARPHTRVQARQVFTQTTVDEEGWPIRAPDSTSYVGAIETAEEFGFRIYTEAWRRG